LERETRNPEEIGYFAIFKPDSTMLYYILAVRADTEKATGAAPTVYAGEVEFDSLTVIAGSWIAAIDVKSMLQRRWYYSGSDYCGLEPIPIPKKERTVSLRVTLRVKAEGGSSDFESVTLTLPVARKRLTRTLLNPWP
jgi:hypothetical protein